MDGRSCTPAKARPHRLQELRIPFVLFLLEAIPKIAGALTPHC
ncbi:MAG: hypothetical protein ACRDNR_05850 [Gaiellaceae bacterium]